MSELNVFVPIKKVDVAQRLVYGQLAAEVPDHSGEIMDYETSAPNWKMWSDEIHKATDGKSLGNVRSMHTNIAAGKMTDITFDDENKAIVGCAKIVDDNEWNKVLEGVYTGFSMGGKYVKRWADTANPALKRYTASVHEVSLVDSPCIPTAKFFDVVKADGTTELRKFKVVEDAEAAVEQVWLAKDGSTHSKKADAQQKNLELAAEPDALTKAQEAVAKAEDALAEKTAEINVEKAAEAEPAKDAGGNIVTEADAVKVVSANLQKNLGDVPALVDVINSLSWLIDGMKWDVLFSDEPSDLAERAKPILADLCAFLTLVVADATAEITADKAAGMTASHVASLRKFAGNDDLLKDFAEAEVKNEPLEKFRAESAAQIEKITHDLESEKAAKAELEKAVTTMTTSFEDMTKRIDHLERQPAPAKGVKGSVTVLKGHEGAASGADTNPAEVDVLKFAHLPPDEARARIKALKSQ